MDDMVLQHPHARNESSFAQVASDRRHWWSFIKALFEAARPRARRQSILRERPVSEENLFGNSLSMAMDADKGVRARALDLFIVEQTLRQKSDDKLGIVPREILVRALPQLERLSSFRHSAELQALARWMKDVIDEGLEALMSVSSRESIEVANIPARKSCEPRETSWLNSTHQQESSSVSDDDGFPDTEAFVDHEEIPIPMPTPPIDRGAAMPSGGLWR